MVGVEYGLVRMSAMALCLCIVVTTSSRTINIYEQGGVDMLVRRCGAQDVLTHDGCGQDACTTASVEVLAIDRWLTRTPNARSQSRGWRNCSLLYVLLGNRGRGSDTLLDSSARYPEAGNRRYKHPIGGIITEEIEVCLMYAHDGVSRQVLSGFILYLFNGFLRLKNLKSKFTLSQDGVVPCLDLLLARACIWYARIMLARKASR
ncbi:hypothetical protein L210DRAFT_3530020 [Boletus edulis BED1]|uniref:Secreted protein n=1 Tax=Boletus edulis BED1 TaxID=1328754 RepID=A0AAD4C2Q4_BOLED|nr:hypothetical protein L210DRAFT_3530020 [Boletus edulis BED1]